MIPFEKSYGLLGGRFRIYHEPSIKMMILDCVMDGDDFNKIVADNHIDYPRLSHQRIKEILAELIRRVSPKTYADLEFFHREAGHPWMSYRLIRAWSEHILADLHEHDAAWVWAVPPGTPVVHQSECSST